MCVSMCATCGYASRLDRLLLHDRSLCLCGRTQSVQLNEEVRLALYGQAGLDALDAAYLPDLIGTSEILQDDHLQQLSKHMPARVEGCFLPGLLMFQSEKKWCRLRFRVPVDAGVQHVAERLQPQLALPENGRRRQSRPARHRGHAGQRNVDVCRWWWWRCLF